MIDVVPGTTKEVEINGDVYNMSIPGYQKVVCDTCEVVFFETEDLDFDCEEWYKQADFTEVDHGIQCPGCTLEQAQLEERLNQDVISSGAVALPSGEEE